MADPKRLGEPASGDDLVRPQDRALTVARGITIGARNTGSLLEHKETLHSDSTTHWQLHRFGESTRSTACYSRVAYSPRIQSLLIPLVTPTARATS